MKIKVFVVTYKNQDLLERCLASLLQDPVEDGDELQVSVMNNFGELVLSPEFTNRVSVINNNARPDFSTGHLSRSWNECIMHAFGDIRNPLCDVLILCQNDTEFEQGYLQKLKECVGRYSYITLGHGDEVQIMTPEAVCKTGLFDERFCNIGFQEADYFLRAVITNPHDSSINDHFHKRLHNPLDDDIAIIKDCVTGYFRNDENHLASMRYHNISRIVFLEKWLPLLDVDYCAETRYPIEVWDDHVKTRTEFPKQFMLYPYFEGGFPELDRKYFIIGQEHESFDVLV